MTAADRTVAGIVVPYNETTFFTEHTQGERVLPGAFTASVARRGSRVRLFSNHTHARAVGKAVAWNPDHRGGLWARFELRPGADADAVLDDIAGGYLDAFSVGFRPRRVGRGSDGAREIVEADLMEVSLVGVAAYEGARIYGPNHPYNAPPMKPRPKVDLTPIPRLARAR